MVNDDYAYNNPTHIIGVNGIEYEEEAPETNEAFPPTEPIDVPGLPRQVKQVYIGDVQVKEQFDRLINFNGNGGGSEIVFTRADGFLVYADGQVQPSVYLTRQTVSRKDIRNERFVEFASEWDGDWEEDNFEQNIAIYEEDNRNSQTLTGSLSTTLGLSLPPVTSTRQGTIGFTINFKSDDEIIYQVELDRATFFPLNRTNLTGQMHKGWPVREKNGPVSFTLNDRTLY